MFVCVKASLRTAYRGQNKIYSKHRQLSLRYRQIVLKIVSFGDMWSFKAVIYVQVQNETSKEDGGNSVVGFHCTQSIEKFCLVKPYLFNGDLNFRLA